MISYEYGSLHMEIAIGFVRLEQTDTHVLV